MTLVSLPSPIHWPGIGGINNLPATGNIATLTTAGTHYQAYVFVAREDMTISHVAFRVGSAATGTPTLEVRIETLDASGFPSGSLWGTNTNGTTGTLTGNSNALQALTASASITKGQVFALKLLFAAGTTVSVAQMATSTLPFTSTLPYIVTNIGTPTKAVLGNAGLVGFGSSSTTFYQVPGTAPYSGATSNAFNNTNAAKRGLVFTPPMNCRAIGIRFFNGTSTGDFNAGIYDNAGSELSSSSTAFDGDFNTGANSAAVVYFDNPVTLSAGTTYRAAIEPTTTTNVTMAFFTLQSANFRGASPIGTMGNYTTLASGTWTDTATDQVPMVDVIIDQIDNGAGNGFVGVIGG